MMLGLRFNKYRDMDLYIVYKAAKARRNYSYLIKEVLHAYLEGRKPVVPALNLMSVAITPEDPKIAATSVSFSEKYDADIIALFNRLLPDGKTSFVKFLLRTAMVDELVPLFFSNRLYSMPIMRSGNAAPAATGYPGTSMPGYPMAPAAPGYPATAAPASIYPGASMPPNLMQSIYEAARLSPSIASSYPPAMSLGEDTEEEEKTLIKEVEDTGRKRRKKSSSGARTYGSYAPPIKAAAPAASTTSADDGYFFKPQMEKAEKGEEKKTYDMQALTDKATKSVVDAVEQKEEPANEMEDNIYDDLADLFSGVQIG